MWRIIKRAGASGQATIGLVVLLVSLLPVIPGQATAQVVQSDGRTAQTIIRYDTRHHPVIASQGMVVSQNALASEIGARVLGRGGNAIDAAVATGLALAVTLPRAGNLGGSGFMLIHLAAEHETIALDYRSLAPALASDGFFRDEQGEVDWDRLTFGPQGAGVPGTVAGFYEAWQRFGSLPWPELVEPARQLAATGFEVTHDLAAVLAQTEPVLNRFEASRAAYLKKDGTAPEAGERLVLPDLAWSLGQLQKYGADAFYRGELATRIASAFEAAGGLIRSGDLASYRVREREVISVDYRGHRVHSMPLVSGGGVTLVQMLQALSHFDMEDHYAGSAAALHLLAEVMKRGAANRRAYLGDPDFSDIDVAGYRSPAVARTIAEAIDPTRATPKDEIAPSRLPSHQDVPESEQTTHFSVMDRDGNAVSNTYTLGYSFGGGWVADGTGILFDNQMRNFKYSGGPDHPNALRPGQRMVSTMTPTIVLAPSGKVKLVTGTPGGSRIINVVLQLLVGVIDHGLGIAEATHRPRIHQDVLSGGKLGVEVGTSPDTVNVLRALGHEVEWQMTMGSTQSIQFDNGLYFGAADPRRPNALAVGVDEVKERQNDGD